MPKKNYILLTGAMGAGKTSVLNKLKELGYECIDEPARVILKEQREINGEGVPEKNAKLFNSLMFERMISQYEENSEKEEFVFFDRGIPDIIAYAGLLNTDANLSIKAAGKYLYNKSVFMFNAWQEIYVNDEERKVDFDTANNFGAFLRKIYEELNYTIIDVPFTSIEERTMFISDSIKKLS